MSEESRGRVSVRFSKLRLNGFKSFVDPTDLIIADGLTGVVGPNGCGKSNLLEALRWVMGENRPTAMRGGGMEDVIFAGTATRPARNFAEVSLQIDNSKRLAPASFNENDFLEDCDIEGNHEDGWFGNDCFDLVYPISLFNSNGDVVTIDSEEGLLEYIEEWYSENCNNTEDCEFDFEVVFPITVEYYSENNQQTQTLVINSEEELDEYIEEYCN